MNYAPALPAPSDTDPVGLWYRARRVDGIDDRMWFGFFERGATTPHWLTLSHQHYDGIGALAELLAVRGWRVHDLPAGRDRAPPGWRARLRRAPRVEAPPPAAPAWRDLDPARAAEPATEPPVAVLLADDEETAIAAAARAAGVSLTSWLLWTADRAARDLLTRPGSTLPWVFPVNLRGAVAAARPTMNHCSGVAVTLDDATSPAATHAQVAARLAAGEHWRQWTGLTLGRHVGPGGIRLLYRLLRAPAGRHAGSYSNLGDWPPAGLEAPADCPLQGLVAVAPGSPAYPVSMATLRWRGRRVLACRLHPVLDRPGRAAELVARWRALAAGRG